MRRDFFLELVGILKGTFYNFVSGSFNRKENLLFIPYVCGLFYSYLKIVTFNSATLIFFQC